MHCPKYIRIRKDYTLPPWVIKALNPHASLRQHVIITLLSLVLFVAVGLLCEQNTGFTVFTTGSIKIYLQFSLLSLTALALNPVCAFAVGFLGHWIVDAFLGIGMDYVGLWVGSGVFGLTVSLFSRYLHVVRHPKHPEESEYQKSLLNGRRFFASVLLASIIAWPLVSTVLNIVLLGVSPEDAFGSCLQIGLIDFIVTIVFDAVIILFLRRQIIAPIVVSSLLVAALFVASHGNSGIGSIILYILALVSSIHVAVVVFLLPNNRDMQHWEKTITVASGIFVLIFGLVAIFFGVTETHYAPSGNEQVIIVPGCSLNGSRPGSILASRLDSALSYAEDHPDAIFIVSGGQGESEEVSEAQAMHDYLIEHGIKDSRIYLEDKSTTTAENLNNSREIMLGLGLNEHTPVVIATSSPHCFRSYHLALRCGFTSPSVLGAPIPWTLTIPEYSRELLAIVKFAMEEIILSLRSLCTPQSA